MRGGKEVSKQKGGVRASSTDGMCDEKKMHTCKMYSLDYIHGTLLKDIDLVSSWEPDNMLYLVPLN